jgi:N utilization substance protein A
LKDINDVLTIVARRFIIKSNEAICMLDRHKTDLVPSSESQNAAEQFGANFDAELKELGVENDLKDVPGLTTLMLFVLGEHGIKSIEDLADCATDDLDGWNEFKNGKTIKHAGILDRYRVSRQDCEAIIINARTKAGWFK